MSCKISRVAYMSSTSTSYCSYNRGLSTKLRGHQEASHTLKYWSSKLQKVWIFKLSNSPIYQDLSLQIFSKFSKSSISRFEGISGWSKNKLPSPWISAWREESKETLYKLEKIPQTVLIYFLKFTYCIFVVYFFVILQTWNFIAYKEFLPEYVGEDYGCTQSK